MSEHPSVNMFAEESTSRWCLCLWSAGIVHPATWRPEDQWGGFSISEKCSETGEPSDRRIVFPSMKYCLKILLDIHSVKYFDNLNKQAENGFDFWPQWAICEEE